MKADLSLRIRAGVPVITCLTIPCNHCILEGGEQKAHQGQAELDSILKAYSYIPYYCTLINSQKLT